MKKKQIRKMQQGCCNVDNYQRMSTKAGEKAHLSRLDYERR